VLEDARLARLDATDPLLPLARPGAPNHGAPGLRLEAIGVARPAAGPPRRVGSGSLPGGRLRLGGGGGWPPFPRPRGFGDGSAPATQGSRGGAAGKVPGRSGASRRAFTFSWMR
jgi:hypothetical protein